ncbi:uncharacterized protein A1O9_09159 [Exophiala aquamarina CBS 119918]|uniref:Zn(2)-C6 fungal-type domain-containing protein n=1 Tax=Exophiala aquamarina CBS 119918 TaxID=1182545 RepID=A0A072P4S7_9EURO|nr:uncharacterized protein A1O9_09159 [Exophiala aquamarina CBS 119918]KEF54717.1 hypothetical protein A1O9_09159 [Exophiala aquamarina CBS 119918]
MRCVSVDLQSQDFYCSSFRASDPRRRDAAQKHATTHSKTASITSAQITGTSDRGSSHASEKGLQAACLRCAKNKTKCDRQIPCGRCRLKNLSCLPRTSRRRPSSTDPGFNVPERSSNDQHRLARHEAADSLEISPITTTQAPFLSVIDQQLLPQSQQNFSASDPSENQGQPRSGNSLRSPPNRRNPSVLLESRQTSGQFATIQAFTPVLEGFDVDPLFPEQTAVVTDPQHTNDDINAALHEEANGQTFSQSQPDAGIPNILENASHVFSQFDWGWEGLFASQAATPNFHSLFLPVDALSSAPSLETQSAVTPTRSTENVARLGDNYADAAPWSHISITWRAQHFKEHEYFENVRLAETTRERILATAQNFFRLTLDSLNVNSNPGTRFLMADLKRYSSSSILMLPPTPILQIYLDTFLTSFEPYFPLVDKRSFDPNAIASGRHEQLAIVMLLLMIAYGAMRDPAIKARRLSMGLLEICRLTTLHLLDKDNSNPRSMILAECALLSTYQAAFSGDKWLMESSFGQMHQYLMLSKHSRFFERDPPAPYVSSDGADFELLWHSWLEREYTSSLVMVDAEISILYDKSPTLTIPDLEKALPDSDDLWLAPDAPTWFQRWKSTNGPEADVPTAFVPAQTSLPELFQSLLDNKLDHWKPRLQILHLRLLLYPIYILTAQLCELMLCVSDKERSRFSPTAFHTSSALRFDEIKSLLQTWWSVFRGLDVESTRHFALQQVTEILYHLLNLKLAVSWSHVEQFSRAFSKQPQAFPQLSVTAVRRPREAVFHCGQILRILHNMDTEIRPLWWPSALHRVAIILWTLSMIDSTERPERSDSAMTPNIAIDRLPPDDPIWQPFLRRDMGGPCLTAEDGSLQPIDDASTVLQVCSDSLRRHKNVSYLAESLLGELDGLANL